MYCVFEIYIQFLYAGSGKSRLLNHLLMAFIQSEDFETKSFRTLVIGRTYGKVNDLLRRLHNLASEMVSGKCIQKIAFGIEIIRFNG